MKLSELLNESAEAQSMKGSVDALHTSIKKLFPNSYLHVQHNTNLMDDITIRFTIEPKDKWPNNIFHNAQNITLMLSEKNKRRETGEGPYQAEEVSSHLKAVQFRKKTGTLDKVVAHVISFFTKLKNAQSQPVKESIDWVYLTYKNGKLYDEDGKVYSKKEFTSEEEAANWLEEEDLRATIR